MTAVGDLWHRYEDQRSASLDEWGGVASTRTDIVHREYVVVKVTPKGAWLQQQSTAWGSLIVGDKFFVLEAAVRKKAYPTKIAAMESLIARKKRQAAILSKQLYSAELAHSLAKMELGALKKAEGLDAQKGNPNELALSI